MTFTYKIQGALFILGITIYLLTSGAYFDNPDGRSMYSVTRNIVLRGTITIPDTERLEPLFEKPGRDQAFYSKYGLVQPLLQVPLFILASTIHTSNERLTTESIVALFQTMVSALILPLLWQIANTLCHSVRVALAITLSYGFATMAWLYATMTYTEPLLSLLLLLIAWLFLRVEQSPVNQTRYFISIGTLASIAILTKYAAIIYIPAILWYAWKLCSTHNRRRITFLIAPLIIGMLLLACYNFWRYENILNTGYDIREFLRFPRPIWYGLYFVLLSPGKSIFLYAPPLILACFLLPQFIRLKRLFAHYVLVLSLSSLLFYAAVNPWAGAWSPGPRYHLPLVALLILPSGCLFVHWSSIIYAKRILIAIIIGAGVIVQLVAVSISYTDIIFLIERTNAPQKAWGFWFVEPGFSPILWQLYATFSACVSLFHGYMLVPALAQVPSIAHPQNSIVWFNYWWFNGIVTEQIQVHLMTCLVVCTLLSSIALYRFALTYH